MTICPLGKITALLIVSIILVLPFVDIDAVSQPSLVSNFPACWAATALGTEVFGPTSADLNLPNG
jgi:hypothetical protein